MRKLLFISWDGPQVNYLEGLFLPILEGLRDQYDLHIIQFTWGGDPQANAVLATTFRNSGIHYTRREVVRSPNVGVGTLKTLWRGKSFIRKYIRTHYIDLLLVRSIFPAAMVLGSLGKGPTERWIFDADGLPLEERVDFAGMNPGGLIFRLLKRVESKMIERSDRVLIRSVQAIPYLTKKVDSNIFQVVSNGRDPERFHPGPWAQRQDMRKEWGLTEDGLALIYAGSLGPQYCLDQMIQLFELVLQARPGSILILLTANPELVGRLPVQLVTNILVKSLPAREVPPYLAAADVGLAFRQQAPSMKGVFPIKIGEYLLSGLPVVATLDIGDTDTLLGGENACLLVDGHTPDQLKKAADWIVQVVRRPEVREAARRLGLERFSLQQSIDAYRSALEERAG